MEHFGFFYKMEIFINMITCKICGIQKEETKFYTYQNPGGQVKRRQKCKLCISKRELARYWVKKTGTIPIAQKEIIQPQIVSNEVIKTKTCKGCNQDLPINNFYFLRTVKCYTNKCKKCYNVYKRPESAWDILTYKANPGEWDSDGQKEIVHSILKAIGWSYNEEKDIWYKKGIKDENGVFENLKPYIAQRRDNYNNPVILNLEQVYFEYQKGKTFTQLALKYGCSKNTIAGRIYKYKREMGL